MPFARQRLLAPAIFLPVIVVALLSWFFMVIITSKKKASRFPGKLLYVYGTTYLFPGQLPEARMKRKIKYRTEFITFSQLSGVKNILKIDKSIKNMLFIGLSVKH
jgi:hypothetical protein